MPDLGMTCASMPAGRADHPDSAPAQVQASLDHLRFHLCAMVRSGEGTASRALL